MSKRQRHNIKIFMKLLFTTQCDRKQNREYMPNSYTYQSDTNPIKTTNETQIQYSPRDRLDSKSGWKTSTRCLYRSKNLGISEDATVNDGGLIDKSIG